MKSELAGDEPLSDYALGYLNERVRNSFYDYVLQRFHEAVEQKNFTRAKLARRLGLEPARVTRLLGSPGNWTLDTVSELLIGICREELQPRSKPYLERAARNFQPDDLLQLLVAKQQSKRTRLDEELMGSQIQSNIAPIEVESQLSQSRPERLPSMFG